MLSSRISITYLLIDTPLRAAFARMRRWSFAGTPRICRSTFSVPATAEVCMHSCMHSSVPRAHLGKEIEIRLHHARPGVGPFHERLTGRAETRRELRTTDEQLTDLRELRRAPVGQAGAGAIGHPPHHRRARVADHGAGTGPGFERDDRERLEQARLHHGNAARECVELVFVGGPSEESDVPALRH